MPMRRRQARRRQADAYLGGTWPADPDEDLVLVCRRYHEAIYRISTAPERGGSAPTWREHRYQHDAWLSHRTASWPCAEPVLFYHRAGCCKPSPAVILEAHRAAIPADNDRDLLVVSTTTAAISREGSPEKENP